MYEPDEQIFRCPNANGALIATGSEQFEALATAECGDGAVVVLLNVVVVAPFSG